MQECMRILQVVLAALQSFFHFKLLSSMTSDLLCSLFVFMRYEPFAPTSIYRYNVYDLPFARDVQNPTIKHS